MGCGASSASAAVPAASADAAKADKGKKRDIQTTYRERLGEDFMKDFAKSQDAIRRLSAPAPERSHSPGSCASAASTTVVGEEFGAIGTLISPYHLAPYATPPKDTLPEAGAENPAAADTACAAPVDASGPYISSAAKADARFGTGLGLVTTMSPGGGRGALSRAGSSDSEESAGRRRALRRLPDLRAGR